jgi:hypothetical protein
MIWVTWRQHRTQAIACAAIFCLLAIVGVTTGISMRSTFSSDGLTTCLARSGGADCQAAIASFLRKFSTGVTAAMALPLLAIPVFLGAITGPLLLGRELEQGTWRLAWSQTVPRARWLVTKLVLVTGGLVVFGAAVSLLTGWLLGPLDQVSGRLQLPVGFDAQGVVFTCSLLSSFGLGVLAGLLLRNTVGAMVVTYVAWEVVSVPVLLMSTGTLHIPGPATMRLPCRNGCPGASTSSVFPVTGHLGDQVLSLTRSGGELSVSYLPASRFWPMQFIVGGWYLAVAATAVAAAIWLLNRRTT